MISAARLAIDRAEAGLPAHVADVPAFQWRIYWAELAPLCPSRLSVEPVRQRNALRIEILPSTEPRCSRKSPDGRGLAWFLSGGDALAYGACCESGCPMTKETR